MPARRSEYNSARYPSTSMLYIAGFQSLICFSFELSVTVHFPSTAAGSFQKNTRINEIMRNAFQGFYFYKDLIDHIFLRSRKKPPKSSGNGGYGTRNQDPPSSQANGTKARLSMRSVEMGMRKVESLDFGYGIVDGSVDYLPD